MSLSINPHSQKPINDISLRPNQKLGGVRFGSDKVLLSPQAQKAKPTQPNLFKRIWRWLNDFSEKFKTFFRQLLGYKAPAPYVSTVPPKSTKVLYSHIDPKLTNDPAERRRITAKLADETFNEVVSLVQNRTVKKDANGQDVKWNELAGQVLTPVAQKLLNTNTTLRFKFNDDTPMMGAGGYHPPGKHVNGPGSSRESLGLVMISEPLPFKYDLSIPAHRQAFYSFFIHELEHMTRSYARDQSVDSCQKLKKVREGDPLKKLYVDAIIGPSIGGHGDVMKGLLSEQNPNLPDLEPYYWQDLIQDMNVDAVQVYWEPLQSMWERSDFPLLTRSVPVKEKFDELLDKGDPQIIKIWIEQHLVDELESYMTSLRRAPGIPKDRLQPIDFFDIGAAMFLRDMIRYYYQHPKHNIPPSEQNPLAQVRPFKDLFEEYNA